MHGSSRVSLAWSSRESSGISLHQSLQSSRWSRKSPTEALARASSSSEYGTTASVKSEQQTVSDAVEHTTANVIHSPTHSRGRRTWTKLYSTGSVPSGYSPSPARTTSCLRSIFPTVAEPSTRLLRSRSITRMDRIGGLVYCISPCMLSSGFHWTRVSFLREHRGR